MSNLIFTSQSTALEGKQGKLRTNSKGWVEVLAGAYNIPNTADETYLLTERVKQLFVKSIMIEKLNKNQLYGECNHPALDDYRSKTRSEEDAVALWINRLMRIDTTNLAMQIMGVRWEKLPNRVNNRDVYGVYLWIKPIHEHLKESLADPEQNTAFSVRSFVDRFYKMGEAFCEMKELITYDWIISPGIPLATKYDNPGLESEQRIKLIGQDAQVTPKIITSLDNMERSERLSGVAQESTQMMTTTMIRDLAGWREVPDLGALASRNW